MSRYHRWYGVHHVHRYPLLQPYGKDRKLRYQYHRRNQLPVIIQEIGEIEYEYEGNKYRVIYGHLYPHSALVKVGQKVNSWQKIGEVGTTGYSTGNHLHFQVSISGKKIDGMNLIDFTSEKTLF